MILIDLKFVNSTDNYGRWAHIVYFCSNVTKVEQNRKKKKKKQSQYRTNGLGSLKNLKKLTAASRVCDRGVQEWLWTMQYSRSVSPFVMCRIPSWQLICW